MNTQCGPRPDEPGVGRTSGRGSGLLRNKAGCAQVGGLLPRGLRQAQAANNRSGVLAVGVDRRNPAK